VVSESTPKMETEDEKEETASKERLSVGGFKGIRRL